MSILAQSQLLVKMIATVIAHTGFEDLMLHIRELVMKYESKEKIIDLSGEFVTADPRSWRKRRSATVRVGIGYAGKQEELSLLQNLLSLQEKAIEAQGGVDGPLTSAAGLYNTIKRIASRIGVKDVQNYFQDPATYQAPPPKPSLAEISLDVQTQKIDADIQSREADKAVAIKKIDMERELGLAKLTQDERLQRLKLQNEMEMFDRELLFKYGQTKKEDKTRTE
jgi:hypothetical protein